MVEHYFIRTEEEALAYTDKIVPVVYDKFSTGLRAIKDYDVRNAYLWDPKYGNVVDGIEILAAIPTSHTYGYAGLFKPSVLEVIRCIPAELLEKTCAFQIDRLDGTGSECHFATTTLYTKA